ncbi:MAG TPA: pentapeptide repeat-containing protein, partial [Rhizomicrobium sp.]|nr:pentapeptide repeat-containing protein [Rhizomicrobium sp.]
GALLHGAKFKNALLTNAVFKDAVLTGVNLEDLQVPPESLEGALQDVTEEAKAGAHVMKALLEEHRRFVTSGGQEGRMAVLDGADLRPLQSLSGWRLTGFSARDAIGIDMDFSSCQLQAAKLMGADLRGANFTQADLRGVSFRGAKLAHAVFKGANIGSLTLGNGTVMATDISDAEMSQDQFADAIRG